MVVYCEMNALKALWLAFQIAVALFICVFLFLLGFVAFTVYEIAVGILSIFTHRRYVPLFELLRMSI